MYDEFLNITGFNIQDFFERFVDFINNRSQLIIDYYSGLVDNLDRDSFGEYELLLNESTHVLDLFDLNQERFNTVDFWELMEFADDIKIKLETIGNFSVFTRSAVKKESFTNDVVIEEPTRDKETIEEMADRLGSIDRDNDWVDIAISNALIQEDYTLDGGRVLNVTFKNNSKFFIDSIVGNPEGELIKGYDIDRYIQFEGEDLKILSLDETLQQTVDILISLNKNDNPEFPQYGIDKTLILGMSLKSILLPSIIRQIYQTFSTDDIIDRVQLLDSNFDQDSLNISLNVNIKSGEEQKRILSINGN